MYMVLSENSGPSLTPSRAHDAQQHQRSASGEAAVSSAHSTTLSVSAAVTHQRFQKRRQQHGGQAVAEQNRHQRATVGAVAASWKCCRKSGLTSITAILTDPHRR